jgi:hypothetical protein
MERTLEMYECLNENCGVARSTDARGNTIVNGRIRLESARGTVTELTFFRTYLTTLPVQKAAVR